MTHPWLYNHFIIVTKDLFKQKYNLIFDDSSVIQIEKMVDCLGHFSPKDLSK